MCTRDKLSYIKQTVLAQVDERDRLFQAYRPHMMWSRVLDFQKYVFDLSPESLMNIRGHVNLFTVDRFSDLVFINQDPSPEQAAAWAEATLYSYFGEGVPIEVWASEPPIPCWGAYRPGVPFKGKTLSPEIPRIQQYICNLWRSGALRGNENERSIFLEIGPGYGALAHSILSYARNVSYIICDLPEMIIYSACYIVTQLPDRSIYIYNPGDSAQVVRDAISRCDVVFIPNYLISILSDVPSIDVAINTVSFAEMEEVHVVEYLDILKRKLSKFLFSVNYDSANPQRTPISKYLEDRFYLRPSIDSYIKALSIDALDFVSLQFRPTFFCCASEIVHSNLDNRTFRFSLYLDRRGESVVGEFNLSRSGDFVSLRSRTKAP